MTVELNAGSTPAQGREDDELPVRGPAAPRGIGRDLMLAQIEAELFDAEDTQPFRVGRFTVLEKLGAGGMGVVYAAFDPDLERKVAIKFLRQPSRESAPGEEDSSGVEASAKARLRREAQALARLDHPNVVSVYDVGDYEGGVYIAMEFVRGVSLAAWLAAESRPDRDAIIRAFVQAGRGLAAAHAVGLVHRDFKPANAIMGDDGRVRVLDFGLAVYGPPAHKPLPPGAERDSVIVGDVPTTMSALTRTGAVLGTPLYMAPEQHLGERSDARCDQFALCVALWMALFEQAPFAGSDLESLRASVLAGERVMPPVRGTRFKVPRHVREALARGLSRAPEDRFERIEELLLELDRDLRRRRAAVWTTLGVTVAALGGGLLAWTIQEQRAPGVCETAAAEIGDIWSPAKAESAAALFADTAASTTWKALRRDLDTYVDKWGRALAASCTEGGVDLDRMSCLAWRRQELDTVSTVLLESSPAELHLVAQAVADLTAIETCTDPRALRVLPPPHRDPVTRKRVQELRIELVRAQVLERSGRHEQALRMAHSLADAAAEIDDPALRAECALLLGEIFMDAGKLADAELYLERALDLGEAGAHDILRARALADLVGLYGFALGRPTARLEAQFRALHARIGDLPTRAHVDFLLNVTMTRLSHGRLEAAERVAREALAEARRIEIDPTRARAQLALALTLLGRYPEAATLIDAASTDLDHQHPAAVMVLGIAGIQRGFAGHDREAVAAFREALAIEAQRELRQPHYRAIVGTYMASSLDRLGEFDQAVAIQRGAIAQLEQLWGRQHSAVGRAHMQFGSTLADNGDWAGAREHFEASLEIWKQTHGPTHRALAQPETGLARADLEAGRDRQALEGLESAMRKLGAGRGHPAADAQTYFHLARALVRRPSSSPSHLQRARRLADRAEAALSGLGPGYDRDREAIASWRKANAAPALVELDTPVGSSTGNAAGE